MITNDLRQWQNDTRLERWYNVIDAARALRYRKHYDMSWREVGIKLAKEEGREIAYQAESVKAAVTRYRRGDDE